MTVIQTSRRQVARDIQPQLAAGPILPDAIHSTPPTEPARPDPISPEANTFAASISFAPQGTQLAGNHQASEAQRSSVVGTTIPGDQVEHETQAATVSGATIPPAIRQSEHNRRTLWDSTSGGHYSTDTHVQRALGILLDDPILRLLADSLDDLEKVRIATENRVRQLTRTEVDKDGEQRGFGLTLGAPGVRAATEMLEQLRATEHEADLQLRRRFRQNPLSAWQKREKGVGERQAARLIAAIGDPYWNTLYNRPRTVSELWAWCGYAVHDGTPQHRMKGQQSNWSSTAKMRAFLIAESCVKSTGHYRSAYDAARAKYAIAIHPSPCKRCGPSGHPAEAGTPLSKGHQHARALRLVAKEILKDLWLESRHVYQESES